MLSFPSAINQGGISNTLYDIDNNEVYEKENNQLSFDVSRIKAMNINLNSTIKKELLADNNLDISMNNYRMKPRKFVNSGATQLQGQKDNIDNEYMTWTEDPLKVPGPILATTNKWTTLFKTPVNNLYNAGPVNQGSEGSQNTSDNTAGTLSSQKTSSSGEKTTQSQEIEISGLKTVVTQSIFSPIHVIQVVGMQENTPLINLKTNEDTMIVNVSESDSTSIHDFLQQKTENKNDDELSKSFIASDKNSGIIMNGDTTQIKINYNPFDNKLIDNSANCTIRELVNRSHTPNGVLGQAIYKYSDFLFCKHVGKVSNNHMITLRRFAHPVGDNIFRYAGKAYLNEKMPGYHGYQENSSIGTMITWFGTEDNKLEDILNYSFNATWKEFTSEIRHIEGKEDDSAGGVIGMFANSFNPSYNSLVARGMAGSNSLWARMGSAAFGATLGKVSVPFSGGQKLQDAADGNGRNSNSMEQWELMRVGADHNKIYTPQNTIQSTHKYEGRLILQHEFTLNFSYRLRAFDVMNPKSVMLDLLGNILEVTYNRGHFWGGENRFIGPPRNSSGIATANAFIDRQWEKLEGFMQGFSNGTIDWKNILSSLSDMVSSAVNAAKDIADSVVNNRGEILNKFESGARKLAGKFVSSGASRALLGQLKNSLGRPAVYAMNSLLSGEPVGLWHVTIGNPKNPIAAFGNMILTNTKITHSGPLGFDDFPTELKVSCTLKHARPRDLSEIARMYTKGTGAFYSALDKNKLSEFFTVANTESGRKVETTLDEANYYKGIGEKSDSIKAELELIEQQKTDLKNKQKEAKQKQQEEAKKQQEEKKNEEQTKREDETKDNNTKKSSSDGSEKTPQPTSQPAQQTDNGENDEQKIEEQLKKLNEREHALKEAQGNLEADMNSEKYKYYTNDNFSIMYGDISGDGLKNLRKNTELYNDVPVDESSRSQDDLMYGHFIRDEWALRYETLGQDLDMEGRILIDENA